MSIFSKIIKPKDAADEQGKASSTQSEPKRSKPPHKHVPTYFALDPLGSTATPFRPEEVRAYIAALRMNDGDMSVTPTFSRTSKQSSGHSRAKSEHSISQRKVTQNKGDLIDAMALEVSLPTPPSPPRRQTYQTTGSPSIQRPHPDLDQKKPAASPPKPRARLSKAHSHRRKRKAPEQHDALSTPSYKQEIRGITCKDVETYHAYSEPREVPMPPPLKHRSYHASSTNSCAMETNIPPMPNLPQEQESDEYSSPSSQGSAFSNFSATSSETSSMTSKHKRTPSGRITSMIPTLPKSPKIKPATHKHQNSIEISLPYVSNDDDNTKTAKSTIPTWRYDDLATDCEPPILVKTISGAHSHSRKSSRSSIFHRRGRAVSVH